MTDYQDKLRSIGVSRRRGSSERKPVIDERDGSQAGYHVEHWDDRQDAVAQPKPIRVRARIVEED